MSAVKRLFQSPFKAKPLRRSRRIRSKNNDGTVPTVTITDREIHTKDDDDAFLNGAVIVESTSSSSSDSEECKKETGDEEDFQTTMIISKSTEWNSSAKEKNNKKDNVVVERKYDGEEKEHESPINSVVFEKRIDTTLSEGPTITAKLPCSVPLSPLKSPCSAAEENDDFDDYRSTISGLTEVSNLYKDRRNFFPPPSPTNSTASAAVTKKMEDFLKTETEAIRQILTEVDSGDDESTVVEDAVRGANEAERMAREMEREMELLISGTQPQTDETKEDQEGDQEVYLQDSPLSDQFLMDIRSVIHPGSESSIVYQCNNEDDQSPVSSMSLVSNRSSTSSPRRDLFRKRSSLYRLNQQKMRQKKLQKRKMKKIVRFCVRTLFLTLILSSMAFMANWKLNFPNHDFTSARRSTMTQLENHIGIKPETTAKIKSFALDTTRTTNHYIGTASLYLVDNTKHYVPLVMAQTKNHVLSGYTATSAFSHSVGSYIWTYQTNLHVLDSISSAGQFVQDRLEYAFTDRAAREKQLEEERKLQELLAAAAKEAAEKQQQQLWTQTMFAGACAFVGSVSTNYIWSAL